MLLLSSGSKVEATLKSYSYFKLVCVASYSASGLLSFGVLTPRVNWDDREKLEDSTSEKKKNKYAVKPTRTPKLYAN